MSVEQNLLWTTGEFELDGEDLWFVPFWLNVLCRYNLSSRKVEQVITFPKTTVIQNGALNVKKIGEKVLVVPAYEKYIYIYNILRDSFTVFDVADKKSKTEKFSQCIKNKEEVYLFPLEYDCILKVNLKDESVKEITCSEQLFSSCVLKNGKVFLVNMTNKLFVFDLCNETLCTEWSDKSDRKWRTIIDTEGDYLLIADMQGEVHVYDTNAKKTVYKCKCPKWIYTGACMDNKVLLCPANDVYDLYIMDMENGVISTMQLVNCTYRPSCIGAFSKVYIEGKNVYFMHIKEKCLMRIDIDKGVIERFSIEIGELDEQVEELFQLSEKDVILSEESSCFVSQKYLLDKLERKEQVAQEKVGERIYYSL